MQQYFRGRRGSELASALLMGGPAIVLLVLFMIIPFARGIQLSLTNQQFNGAQASYVGLSNYDRILGFNVITLPPVPEELPDRRPAVGWYADGDGNPDFRWRPNAVDDLDSIAPGLEAVRDYQLARIVSLGDTHYAIMAKDPMFWQALGNNLTFALIVVPVQTSLALILAMLINQKIPFVNVFRTTYFSPVVTAMVIIAVVWSFLYNPQFGLINQMLSVFHIGPFQWLQDSSSAMLSIIIMSIWQGVGFQMVIFLAGLQDIPEDLYEASSIDGAGAVQKFRFITLPMLRNTTIFVVLTTTILAFRLFDQVNVMTPDGGPGGSTATMVWYVIRTGWSQSQIGFASAISVVFVAIVLLISLVQQRLVRSGDEEG